MLPQKSSSKVRMTFSSAPIPRREIAAVFAAGRGGLNWIAPDFSTPRETVTTTWLHRNDSPAVCTSAPWGEWSMPCTGVPRRTSRPAARWCTIWLQPPWAKASAPPKAESSQNQSRDWSAADPA